MTVIIDAAIAMIRASYLQYIASIVFIIAMILLIYLWFYWLDNESDDEKHEGGDEMDDEMPLLEGVFPEDPFDMLD